MICELSYTDANTVGNIKIKDKILIGIVFRMLIRAILYIKSDVHDLTLKNQNCTVRILSHL